ncbi:MAG: hypothetical protein Q7J38_00770 [Gallionella sp.]|nr:hypothetical protein [Gallionella sp.]
MTVIDRRIHNRQKWRCWPTGFRHWHTALHSCDNAPPKTMRPCWFERFLPRLKLGASAANHISDNKKPRRKTVKKRIFSSPEPYASWVEYAVATADTKDIYHDSIMGVYPVMVSRDDLRQAIKDEYFVLRKAAGVEVSEESIDRINSHWF